MKRSFFKYIFDGVLNIEFRDIGYLPRWIIFMIDVFIVFVASIVTYFIVHTLTNDNESNLNLPVRYALIIFINSFFFLLYRTYAGIIRHSTFIDCVKLLVSTSTSFLALVAINFGWYFIFGQKLYLTTGLFISYVISFLLLFLFRILVKHFFEKYASGTDAKKLTPAVIYGADANAISVANALRTEAPGRFLLRGFIDKFHQDKTSKRILNLPIAGQNKKIHVIMRAMKAEALIIAEKGLTKEETISIVEECLEYDFKVFTVPLISDWEDENQISDKVKNFQIEDLLERKPIVLHTASISAQLKGKVVLITGAAGSIGSEIVLQVLGFSPAKIIMLDQAETP
ncbi:MAG: polysaccharide biosynthesis protein, partial [Flavobacterium sp.]